MGLKIKVREKCLGQITRIQIKPEIVKCRGNCTVCDYDLKNNLNCKAYESIAVRFFEVVE